MGDLDDSSSPIPDDDETLEKIKSLAVCGAWSAGDRMANEVRRLRARVEELEREVEELRAVASRIATDSLDTATAMGKTERRLCDEVERLRAEASEAKAQSLRLQARLTEQSQQQQDAKAKWRAEREQLRAEVERRTRERDEARRQRNEAVADAAEAGRGRLDAMKASLATAQALNVKQREVLESARSVVAQDHHEDPDGLWGKLAGAVLDAIDAALSLPVDHAALEEMLREAWTGERARIGKVLRERAAIHREAGSTERADEMDDLADILTRGAATPTADDAGPPSLADPCPRRTNGRHELYLGGPGGKRDPRPDWLVCQSCGANGPLAATPTTEGGTDG